MRLAQWVEEQIKDVTKAGGEALSKRDVLKSLSERAKVSLMTLAPVERGARMGNYDKARAVSEATGWKVTIPELCDEEPSSIIAKIIHQYQEECGT